jgi:hypothetical protein
MVVSISWRRIAAGQNPLPLMPLIGVATRMARPSCAVPVATSSTGARAGDGTGESGLDSIELTCLPSGSTIQPALILAPRGTAIIDDHALLPGDSIAITANRSPGRLDMQYTLAG